jgi:2-keto-3-deoxy-L-rhamnonate aldolase RhmA
MGIPNDYDSPELIAAIQRVIDTADRKHIASGCWFGKTDQIQRTKAQGARLIVYSNDGNIMREAMRAAFTGLRQAADDR